MSESYFNAASHAFFSTGDQSIKKQLDDDIDFEAKVLSCEIKWYRETAFEMAGLRKQL